MPRVTFAFKLPEEKEELEIFQRALEYHSALYELGQYLRKLNKYEQRDSIPTEEVITTITQILSETDI